MRLLRPYTDAADAHTDAADAHTDAADAHIDAADAHIDAADAHIDAADATVACTAINAIAAAGAGSYPIVGSAPTIRSESPS
jgi:multidrug resistance efflux pump